MTSFNTVVDFTSATTSGVSRSVKTPVALAEALAAAKAYFGAQQRLMELIVDQSSERDVQDALTGLRIARAVYETSRAFDSQQEPGLGSDSIRTTLEFVELVARIRANERLLVEWLNSSDFQVSSSTERYVEQTLAISADPRFDLFVVAGEQSSAMIEALQQRGCARILAWSALCDETADSTDCIDIKKADLVLAAMTDIAKCPPQRIWCLWGEGAQCPARILESLHERVRRVLINANTITALSSSWARQFIRNLPSLVQHGRNTMELASALKGSGAIVIGAGPSLDEHIDWVKAQTPQPVIICAYKALKSLIGRGVTPDFVVMLDPNQKLRHLAGVDLSGIAAFVVEVSVCPEVLARVDRPLLPYSAGDGTSMLFGIFGNKTPPVIPTGGSVLHVELQLAKLLGCTQVTLIGADFGFPSNRLYADGSGTGDVLVLSDDRRSFVRKPLDGEARTGVLVKSVANDGSPMESSLELDAYRLWVEQFIHDWQKETPVEIYNLAEKGARIDGAEFVPASTHRALPATQLLQPLTQTASPLIAKNRVYGSLPETFRKKIKKLRSLHRACSRAIEMARKSPANDLSIYGPVVKQAAACPEVSLLLSKQLREINDQSARSSIDVPQRLLNLIEQAKREASETAELYASVTASIVQRAMR